LIQAVACVNIGKITLISKWLQIVIKKPSGNPVFNGLWQLINQKTGGSQMVKRTKNIPK
jgi:hypothetical protein